MRVDLLCFCNHEVRQRESWLPMGRHETGEPVTDLNSLGTIWSPADEIPAFGALIDMTRFEEKSSPAVQTSPRWTFIENLNDRYSWASMCRYREGGSVERYMLESRNGKSSPGSWHE